MKMNQAGRDEVQQLIAESFFRVDSGRADTGIELVTTDFTLILPNITIDHEQYAGLMTKRVEATYTTRHCVSNVRVTLETEEAIEVAFVVTVHRLEEDAVDTTVTVADFADRWVLHDDEHRLQSRSIKPVFPMGLGA
jgi:SnoaL-like domain